MLLGLFYHYQGNSQTSGGESVFCVCRHSGGFAVYLMERVYFVCAGILLGLLFYLMERVYFVCAGILQGFLFI